MRKKIVAVYIIVSFLGLLLFKAAIHKPRVLVYTFLPIVAYAEATK